MTSQGTRNRLVQRLREKGISDERVLQAIANTPRHLFVDEALASRAYEDTALPIGQGQTISQPFVVAQMTQALLANGIPAKVLELGTGSGYQAAVLAQLAEQVFTIERIDKILRTARRRFHTIGLHNIYTRHADGAGGAGRARRRLMASSSPRQPLKYLPDCANNWLKAPPWLPRWVHHICNNS